MINQDNLKPLNKLSEKEAFEIRSKGGKTRAMNIQRRKTLKEELLLLLEDKDNQKNMTIALLMKALDGDIKAFEVVRDTIGEKPTDKVDTNVNLSYEKMLKEVEDKDEY